MSSFRPFPGWERSGAFEPSGSPEIRFHADTAASPGALPARPVVAEPPVPDADDQMRLKQAYEDGLAAGRSEGTGNEYERVFSSLEAAAQDLLDLRDRYLAANRREVVGLAISVADAVLGKPFGEDAEGLVARLTAAFDHLPSDGPLLLQLSPIDHDLIEAVESSAVSRSLEGRSVELRPDPKLSPGEFRLAAGPAEVDGRKETLLGDLRERLIAAVDEGNS